MALDESLVGTTFADYEIRKWLGGGAQGAVFCAYEKSLRREVALKLLSSDAIHDDALKSRFLEEGPALARLDSPNVVKVYRAGDFQGRLFLSMELVLGTTLKDRLAKGPLSIKETRKWLTELCSALAVVHDSGIVHRDLKPSNVMIQDSRERREPGSVKLIDFGIAKAAERSLELTMGAVIGTGYYLSPEQCDPQKFANQVDSRSDIYSLGIVLFEMFTGHLPFESSSLLGLLVKHLSEPPPAPSSIPGCHPSVDDVVVRCLAKHPDHRPGSVTVVLQLLDRALAHIERDGWAAIRRTTPQAALSTSIREPTESLPPISDSPMPRTHQTSVEAQGAGATNPHSPGARPGHTRNRQRRVIAIAAAAGFALIVAVFIMGSGPAALSRLLPFGKRPEHHRQPAITRTVNGSPTDSGAESPGISMKGVVIPLSDHQRLLIMAKRLYKTDPSDCLGAYRSYWEAADVIAGWSAVSRYGRAWKEAEILEHGAKLMKNINPPLRRANTIVHGGINQRRFHSTTSVPTEITELIDSAENASDVCNRVVDEAVSTWRGVQNEFSKVYGDVRLRSWNERLGTDLAGCANSMATPSTAGHERESMAHLGFKCSPELLLARRRATGSTGLSVVDLRGLYFGCNDLADALYLQHKCISGLKAAAEQLIVSGP